MESPINGSGDTGTYLLKSMGRGGVTASHISRNLLQRRGVASLSAGSKKNRSDESGDTGRKRVNGGKSESQGLKMPPSGRHN